MVSRHLSIKYNTHSLRKKAVVCGLYYYIHTRDKKWVYGVLVASANTVKQIPSRGGVGLRIWDARKDNTEILVTLVSVTPR